MAKKIQHIAHEHEYERIAIRVDPMIVITIRCRSENCPGMDMTEEIFTFDHEVPDDCTEISRDEIPESDYESLRQCVEQIMAHPESKQYLN